MKKTIPITIIALFITFGIFYVASADEIISDTLQVDSLKVGKQGVGGVTFFNGTIINDTTNSSGGDNPITFGDNVRIDGLVYRGATVGTDDDMPFKINDNAEVVGSLTVDNDTITNGNSTTIGNLTVSGNSTVEGNLRVEDGIYLPISSDLRIDGDIYSGSIQGPQDDIFSVIIDDNAIITGTTYANGGITVSDYITLDNTDGQPPSSDCSGGYTVGRMKFDDDLFEEKLWVCSSDGWKSFSAD